MDKLYEKIKEILKGKADRVDSDSYGFEIYTDYRDRELSRDTIKEIIENENPRLALDEKLSEWAFDSENYYWDDTLKEIKDELSEEEQELWEENEDEVEDWFREHIYWYYNENDFNNQVNVNILVDCGNWNYDCTCDNVLNWDGRDSGGEIEDTSSMLWLAKTQGKATKLRKACKKWLKEEEIETDKFIESCIQEFENLPSHMGTVTFLVKMDLFKLFDLLELQKKEYDENGEYDPRKNTKSKSYLILDKRTECGLFNPWSGSGSVLEIELDKDVKLPIKYAKFCVEGCKTYGYDVDEVYGLIDSCWKDTIKEVVEVK